MYAIVDIETTGGYAAANGITEIAIYVHDGFRIVKHFETLINPHQTIPRYITSLTGIDNHMVASAPDFETVAEDIYELLKDNIFIAHNVNFDFSFVRHQLKAAGFDLNSKKLCTVRLSRKVFPGLPSYSLGNLCRSLALPIENRHRAGGDALATVKLLEHCLNNDGLKHIEQMLKKTSSEQWLPLNLNKEDIATLPSCPGVYYVHDSKGKVIYVGKAINLKKRVSSHFTQNDPDRKRQLLLRNLVKISHQTCATELEAIILESNEIKRLWPKFNKSQKQPLQKYALYSFEDNKGYLRLMIDKKKKNLPYLYCFNLLHEGQVMLRKMIAEFGLDEKLCFLDKSVVNASDAVEIESPEHYNVKVKAALEALEQQLPTFAVLDQGKRDGEKLCILIERGIFWGMGYLDEQLEIHSAKELKHTLQPYADNDLIRNSIYSFVALHPEKKLRLSA